MTRAWDKENSESLTGIEPEHQAGDVMCEYFIYPRIVE